MLALLTVGCGGGAAAEEPTETPVLETPTAVPTDTPEPTPTPMPAPIQSLEDAEKGVVYIEGRGSDSGSGSGFFTSHKGYIVTAYHVIEGRPIVDVYVHGEDELYPATVHAVAPLKDIAILKIEGEGFDYFTWHK